MERIIHTIRSAEIDKEELLRLYDAVEEGRGFRIKTIEAKYNETELYLVEIGLELDERK
jgi:hypothetical protein